MLPVSA